jgi:hypothetical protein
MLDDPLKHLRLVLRLLRDGVGSGYSLGDLPIYTNPGATNERHRLWSRLVAVVNF